MNHRVSTPATSFSQLTDVIILSCVSCATTPPAGKDADSRPGGGGSIQAAGQPSEPDRNGNPRLPAANATDGREAVSAAELGARLAREVQRSKPAAFLAAEGLRMAGSGLVPALFLAPGPRFWAGWSPRRCLAWGCAVLPVPPTVLLFFKGLAPTLPLSA